MLNCEICTKYLSTMQDFLVLNPESEKCGKKPLTKRQKWFILITVNSNGAVDTVQVHSAFSF